jgi:hypothetical protein
MGAPVAKPAATTPAAATKPAPVAPVAAAFHDEESAGSTKLTTIMAGALALLSWGVAGILIASYYGAM